MLERNEIKAWKDMEENSKQYYYMKEESLKSLHTV